MKKLLALSILTALSINLANALTAEAQTKALSLLKEKSGSDFEFTKAKTGIKVPALELVFLKVEGNSSPMPVFASEDGSTIIALDSTFLTSNNDIIKNVETELRKASDEQKKSVSDKIIDTIGKKKLAISLKSTAKKPKGTLYIVSDLTCPYCKDEFDRLDEKLKEYNVNMVIVGMLSEDSLKQANSLYSDIIKLGKKPNQKKVISLLKAGFEGTLESTPTKEGIARAKTISDTVKSTGVNSVPYVFEE